MADRVELRIWVGDSDDLAAASSVSARSAGVDLLHAPGAAVPSEDVQQIASVLIGAGALAGARFIKEWWAERGGGLVIDQRPDVTVDISRDVDVPYGYVVVFPTDGGVVKVDVEDAPKGALERWISEVISGGYESVGDLTGLVADKPGGDRIAVVTEPS